MTSSVGRMIWIIAAGLMLGGCAALPKGSVLFQHTPLLYKGTIPLKAGLMTLQDARPPEEQKALRNISAVADQITVVLLKDFKEAKAFESMELVSESSGVDVILRGAIRSFSWRSSWNPLPFIPYVNLVTLFGLPVGKNVGQVGVSLDVVNPRTNQVIVSYAKSSGDERDYSIYQAQDYRASGGEETSDAFRSVVDQLQAAILQDREVIMTAVQQGAAQ